MATYLLLKLDKAFNSLLMLCLGAEWRFCRKRLGELPQEMRSAVLGLLLSALELSEALLDFTSVDDLQAWLEGRSH